MKNCTHYVHKAFNCLMLNTTTLTLFLTALLFFISVGNAMAFKAVAFTQHPAPKTICQGTGTTFSVVASGTGTLTYQWEVSTNSGGAWNPAANGSTYSNAGTATLTVTAATAGMNTYLYRCRVTDNSGNYNSNSAQLTVDLAPTVKTGYGAVSICSNGGGSISAQVFANLTYQWQLSTDNGINWNPINNGAPYGGATTNLLTISSGIGLDKNLYRYIATNSITGCHATSDHDTLHVFQPVITQAPGGAAVCTGSNAVFTAAATGAALSYQWYRQSPSPLTALTDNAPFSGTSTNTLTITGTTTTQNGSRYYLAVTDALSCVTTTTLATLNVYNPLVINAQPRDTFVCANTNVPSAFRITLSSGSQPMTYQWETDNGTNGVTWSNAAASVFTSGTNSALALSNVLLSMNGYKYRVSIAGTCGTVVSNEVTLRVTADGTWRGTTNTDWHNALNWCGGIPTSTTDVLIPAWAPRMPIISANIGYSRALHIEPNARLTISGGTTSMSGPFNIEGTVAYTAAGDQNVLPAAHGSLEINGSGNKYMQSAVGISHNMVLGGSAKLVTGNNVLVMKPCSNPISGVTFNGAVTSWIVTGNGNTGAGNTGIGGLRIEQVDASDGNVLYPVGATPGAYNPLQLVNTGAIDNFTIAVNDLVIPGGVLQSGIDRTWLVSEDVPGGSDIALALRWAGPEELSLFDRTKNEVVRSDGTDIVQSSATAAALGANPYSRSASAFTQLTQFSVASYAKLLPLPLSAFNVQVISQNTARLQWKSDNWQGGGAFIVQKATTGLSFTDIGTVSQEAGKTAYNFTDYQLGDGANYYRLKITKPGFEGQYSKMLQVANPLTGQHVELRPSVTGKELTTLNLALAAKDRLSISIVDVMGRVRSIRSVQLDKGEYNLPVQIGQLPKGIYYVQVTGSYFIHQSLRLVKQ
jgi:hypothetical protein